MSTELLSSKQQLACLNEWLDSTSQIKIEGIPARVSDETLIHITIKLFLRKRRSQE